VQKQENEIKIVEVDDEELTTSCARAKPPTPPPPIFELIQNKTKSER
jgi:hypothetical protein